MAVSFRSIFTSKNPISSLIPFSPTHFPKPPISPFPPLNTRPHLPNYAFLTCQSPVSTLRKATASFGDLQIDGSKGAGSSTLNFDDLLFNLEFLSLTISAAVSLYAAVSYGLQKGAVLWWFRSKVFVWQCVVLVASVVIGAVIRRRQWRRACGPGFSKGANLLRRVEILEEDLRSSASLIRALSRQLEKLGVQVRATQKSLKEPIFETAALARKNSEVARALAAREDFLEKELGEIHTVLLAMQEQQEKVLNLILAAGKARNLLNSKATQTIDPNKPEASNSSSMAGEQNTEISNKLETLDVANASQ
ncbi:hypothetical protein SASPL_154627 [Salvia splendens]|uniref:Uncharacterized protein n=1 Tax=Salvia splendens TaxID=180675 RepID=A0A8X8W0M9_SALSN|nr:uncharacterized protein LOC121787320 [Salvia splendens]KAG6385749.1 hypothetical protein SASPL_154627 [Salvia splendens]